MIYSAFLYVHTEAWSRKSSLYDFLLMRIVKGLVANQRVFSNSIWLGSSHIKGTSHGLVFYILHKPSDIKGMTVIQTVNESSGRKGVYSHWEWKLPIKNSPFNWELLLKHYLSTAVLFLSDIAFSWAGRACAFTFLHFLNNTLIQYLYQWSEAYVVCQWLMSSHPLS